MKKKILSLLLASCLAGLIFTGCSGQTANIVSSESSESAASEESAREPDAQTQTDNNEKSSMVQTDAISGTGLTIYIVRHGRTLFNDLQLMQGACDSQLIEIGIQQAELVGKSLSDIEFAAAYSSDLGRQRDTLRYILAENSNEAPPMQELLGLREVNYGSLEGTPYGDVSKVLSDHLGIDYADFQPSDMTDEEMTNLMADSDPRGLAETFLEVETRLENLKEYIVENHSKGNILLVSSGDTIKKLLNKMSPDEYQGEDIKNCSISIVTYLDGKFHIETLGDISHLDNK